MWYIQRPGRRRDNQAIRTVAFGGTLMTTFSDRQAGLFS